MKDHWALWPAWRLCVGLIIFCSCASGVKGIFVIKPAAKPFKASTTEMVEATSETTFPPT